MKALIATPKDKQGLFQTFFTEENIALANSLGEMVWNESEERLDVELIKEQVSDCDVYVTTWGAPRLDEALLKHMPNLKLLCHLCGTVVPFVSEEMWNRGIRVISGNDFFAESVAEGTIAYMLTALREIPKFTHRFKSTRQWKNGSPAFYTNGLLGKTVGIVSYGAIAKHLVRMLQPFRVKLKVYDIVDIPEEDKEKYGIEQVSLDTLFSTCDVVSVHTPYNDHTHHLIKGSHFSQMKEGSLFVNTSRGAVIDQSALVETLKTGRIHAILDVYSPEPPASDDPLFELPNVIMVPHMAGPTTNLRQNITHDLLLESKQFVDRGGELSHEISRQKAEQMSRS